MNYIFFQELDRLLHDSEDEMDRCQTQEYEQKEDLEDDQCMIDASTQYLSTDIFYCKCISTQTPPEMANKNTLDQLNVVASIETPIANGNCVVNNSLHDHTYCKTPCILTETSVNIESIQNTSSAIDFDSDTSVEIPFRVESDEDYVYNTSDGSCEERSESSEDSGALECKRTFIVYEGQLDKLFQFCHVCSSPVSEIIKKSIGSMVEIQTICLQHHEYKWHSQPYANKNVPIGNLEIPSAIVCTGSTYQEFSNFAKALNLNFISESSFYSTQDNYILPHINKQYKEQQVTLLNELKSHNTALDLCGDGRADSPGHNAKYGTYSIMDEKSGQILDFSLVHVSEVSSSNAMEYEGCKRTLNRLLSNEVSIRCLTTDRHTQITAQLKKNYPFIKHQYDVWHMSKWVTKKLSKKAKIKANKDIYLWIKSINNHFWWCVQTCNQDPKVLVSNWVSIIHHISNKHNWKEGKNKMTCRHPPLSRKDKKEIAWLKSGSSAHVAVEEVICNKRFLEDMVKLTEFHHTGNLEVFHSLLLKYAPKRKHFSYRGMVGRTQLAVIDHNINSNRKQATTKSGDQRYQLVFPKTRKTWVVKPVLTPKLYSFVDDMMAGIVECHKKNIQLLKTEIPDMIPENIATVPRPLKEEVVKNHLSRMIKNDENELQINGMYTLFYDTYSQ